MSNKAKPTNWNWTAKFTRYLDLHTFPSIVISSTDEQFVSKLTLQDLRQQFEHESVYV